MSKSRTGAPRRVAAGLLAGALTVVGVALAPPAGAVDDVQTDRYAGTTRYGTAGAVAGQPDFDGATTAILATGETFPDALAASGLAGANAPAPIILTESDNLSDEARVAMTELGSLDDVVVVGGTAAVSDDVVSAVEDEGYTVNRIAGNDRYETAAAIADEMATVGQIGGLDTAMVASGEVFADALAGGPVAYALGLPLLLVNTDGIPAATEAALDGIEQVVILGGTARITDETETELEELTGNDAIRVAGVDRFETAADIVDMTETTTELAWGPETILLASGLNFPDALAAGPLGGERQAPILLTASLPQPTQDEIDESSDTLTTIIGIGGTGVVSDEDLQGAETLGETTENDEDAPGNSQTSALEGPELQDVSVSALDLDDLEVAYTYTFDEDIDEDSVSSTAEEFKLYDAYNVDGAVPALDGDGDPDVDVSGASVTVVFSLIDENVAAASLAAVEEGAVEDEEGNTNPPQSVEIGILANPEGTGNTQGPDLIDAEVTEDETTDDLSGEFEVEYVFDSPAVPELTDVNPAFIDTLDEADFSVVLDSGFQVDATACETSPEDDEASETVTCTFSEQAIADADGDDDPAENINDAVRAVVDPGAIGNAFFGLNPRQVVELSSSGNADASPSLVRVELDEEDDEVTYVFSESVDTPGTATAGLFELYYSDCTGATPIGAQCIVTGDNVVGLDDDEVTVAFPEGSINGFLAGASVAPGAVTATAVTPAGQNDANASDEVGIAAEFDDGFVGGPQLESVTAEVDTNIGQDFDELTITFTFDANLDEDDAIAAGEFSVWINNEDGESEPVSLDDCEIDDNEVVCTESGDVDDVDALGGVVAAVDADAVISEDVITVDDSEQGVQLGNPEASFAIDIPEVEDTEDEDA